MPNVSVSNYLCLQPKRKKLLVRSAAPKSLQNTARAMPGVRSRGQTDKKHGGKLARAAFEWQHKGEEAATISAMRNALPFLLFLFCVAAYWCVEFSYSFGDVISLCCSARTNLVPRFFVTSQSAGNTTGSMLAFFRTSYYEFPSVN